MGVVGRLDYSPCYDYTFDMLKSMTNKGACELISKYWKDKYKVKIKPRDIWEYSPTGELAMIFLWIGQAKAWFKHKRDTSWQR